jgi:putative transport protein
MDWIAHLFSKNPELGVYLALGIGYWVGTRKFRGFSLGGATGSLLAGILIGAFVKVPVAGMAKSVLFLLFMFGIGYSVGPKFFKAMKGSGWRYGVIGLFVPVVGLLTAWIVAIVLKLDLGFAGGLVSGALTESPAIGTASEAISALTSIPDEAKQKLISHIAVADALCYVFGAFGVIYVCSTLGPKLLGIDLKAEAEKLEAEYGVKRTRAGITSAWQPFEVRAYRVELSAKVVGKTVAAAERLQPDARMFIQRIRRGQELIAATPDMVLQAGDALAVSGRRDVLVELLGEKATEVDDRELLDLPIASFDVFLTSKEFVGRTLESIAQDDAVHSVFLRKITRGTEEIPIGTRTVIERGDVLSVVGPELAVDRAAKRLGTIVRPVDATDFVAVGLAIFLGATLGATIFLPVGTTKIFLGTSVGTLLTGVMTGYLHSRWPLFGRVPDAAVSFMQAIGLSGFVAMIGLAAGPEFLPAVREAGLGLLVGGIFVTLVPQIAGLYFGRYILKANPLLLLGALSGAQTFTPALAAVQEKSGSSIAVLGYTGAVALGHVFLTTWGSVIVLLLAG